MKVKIISENAARMFSCEKGDFRDLQRPDALALIETNDVAAVDEPSAVVTQRKPARKSAK